MSSFKKNKKASKYADCKNSGKESLLKYYGVKTERRGRHGHVYTNFGKINLFNAKYELDPRPIEEGCQCPACRHYSRAYIRHLLKAKEMLGMRLCVLHNLYFYNTMMEEIRQALDDGRYEEYKKQKLESMAAGLICS